MRDEEIDALREGAREWLDAAHAEARAGRLRVAFGAARHASELACKATLLRSLGSYPRSHDVSGLLAQHALLPPGVEGRALSRLLGAFTSGTYGEGSTISIDSVHRALALAEACVAWS